MHVPKKCNAISALAFTYLIYFHCLIGAHGFGAQTYVRLTNNSLQQIEILCKRLNKEKNIYVPACDIDHKLLSSSLLVAFGRSESNCYIQFAFDDRLDTDIICTPYQEFYVPQRGGWLSAYQLCKGDQLLSYSGDLKSITHCQCILNAMPVYIIKVKNTHTFFVGRHSILTHNMDIVTLHLSSCSPVLPITMAGGGACFGPLGAIGMAVVTVGISAIINYCIAGRPQYYTIPFFDERTYVQPSFHVANNQENQALKSGSGNIKSREDNTLPSHPNGIYQDAPYHHKNSTGNKSPSPKNGQKALDNSVPIKENSKARVGVSEGEIVMLRNTHDNIYHGHVETWKNLKKRPHDGPKIMDILKTNNLTNKKGEVLK